QLLDLDDAAGDQWSGELRPAVDLLDLEADAHERLGDRVGGVGAGGQVVDQGGEPGQGNTHVLSPGDLKLRSRSNTEGAAEPDVALDHVTHVGQAVAELQGALQAHTEREAGVDVGVDPAGAQHVRVDHAAAAPLDPARAAPLLREPDVDLGRRLGEGEE